MMSLLNLKADTVSLFLTVAPPPSNELRCWQRTSKCNFVAQAPAAQIRVRTAPPADLNLYFSF